MGRSLSLAAYLAFKRDTSPKGNDFLKEQRPNGPLVWFHLGDWDALNAIEDLAQRLCFENPNLNFLISAATKPKMGPRTNTHYVVLSGDSQRTANIFLSHWKPDLAVWVTGHVLPALLHVTHARGIPNILLNATSTGFDNSDMRWFPDMHKSLLNRFNTILAEDEVALIRLRKLGANPKRLSLSGGLNDAAPILACDELERDDLAEQLAGRSVWFVNSCCPSEIKMIILAHKRAMRSAHRLLLVVTPVDQVDSDMLTQKFKDAGFETVQSSQMQSLDPFVQVLVADEEGDLALWYRLSTLTYVGCTLTDGPKRNPFEAASLGSAILFGPKTGAYDHELSRLERAGAAKIVRNALELGTTVEENILPHKAAEMAHAAWDESTKGAATTDFVKELIFNELETSGAI